MKSSPERLALAALIVVLVLGLAWMTLLWRTLGGASQAAAQVQASQQVLTLLAELRAGAATGAAREAQEARLAALREQVATDGEQYSRAVALGPLLARQAQAQEAVAEPRRRPTSPAPPNPAAGVLEALAQMQPPAEAAVAQATQRSADLQRRLRGLAAGAAALVLAACWPQWQLLRLRRRLRAAEDTRGAELRAAQEATSVTDRLLTLLPDALGLADTEGRIVRTNGAAPALWGRPAAELAGAPLIELVAPEDQRRTERAFTDCRELPPATPAPTLRNRCRHKDGRLLEVQWQLAWLPAEQRMLFLARDVTEIEQLRTQLPQWRADAERAAADAAQAVAAAAAAQHLRADAMTHAGATLQATASGLLLHTQVLADSLAGTLGAEQQRHARAAHASAMLLNRYASELKALGQAESGALALAHDAFDLWETLNSVSAGLRAQAEAKGLRLELQLADDLGYARGDARRFEAVLHGLIDWCVRHSRAGRVAVAAQRAGTQQLQVTVADSGDAAAPQQRALVLAFFQRNAALPQPLGDVGDLGLAAARRFVHAMGGTLQARGAPESSISFVLTLPADGLA